MILSMKKSGGVAMVNGLWYNCTMDDHRKRTNNRNTDEGEELATGTVDPSGDL